MLSNKYINVAVHKREVQGVLGCVQHTYVVSQLMQEAKENWLNIANAYGSMSHRLVQTMLQKYHMPPRVQNVLQHYFESFKM